MFGALLGYVNASMLASELPLWFVRVVAFLWGAVWGSFANVVIYRWPNEMSVVRPGSHCPHCGNPVRSYDNVPILGWLWLRGRCRDCKAPISPRYPLVEALYAVAALTVADRIFRADPVFALSTATALFLLRFAFVWGLLTAAFIDLDWFLLPDAITLTGIVVGIAAAFVLPGVGWQSALEGAALGAAILYSLHFFWSRFLKRDGMGLGDVKLLAMIGAFLGPIGVIFALVAGSVQGILAMLISRLTGWQIGPDPSLLEDDDEAEEDEAVEVKDAARETAKEPAPEAPAEGAQEPEPGVLRTLIPFGPFLALAAIEYLLGADTIVKDLWRTLTEG